MIWIHYWSFVLPLITAACWLTDVVGLLALWVRDGKPQYQESSASFPFISDVGAAHLTWFRVFSVLTAFFYICSAFAERYLRSSRRIPGSVKRRQTIYDIISVVLACLGAIFLIILSNFNDRDYSTVHWSSTLLFIISVGLSVFFQILELFSLSHWHNDAVWHLKVNAIAKAIILGFAFCVLMAFIGTYATCQGDAPGYDPNTYCNKIGIAASVCEWVCSFLLFFFFLSYTVDLWPRNYYGKQEAMAEKRAARSGNSSINGSSPDMLENGHGGGARRRTPSTSDLEIAPQDRYGTVDTTTAPSLSQQPMQEAYPQGGQYGTSTSRHHPVV